MYWFSYSNVVFQFQAHFQNPDTCYNFQQRMRKRLHLSKQGNTSFKLARSTNRMLTLRASIRMEPKGVSDALPVLLPSFARRASAASARLARSWAKFKGKLPCGSVLSLLEESLLDVVPPWLPPSPPVRLPMSQANYNLKSLLTKMQTQQRRILLRISMKSPGIKNIQKHSM